MNVLLSTDSALPSAYYGGTERVLLSLAYALNKMRHNVTIVSKFVFECSYANTLSYTDPDLSKKIKKENIDIIHDHGCTFVEFANIPTLHTIHGNSYSTDAEFHINSVFVSKNHAARMCSDAYVYNGLNWDSLYPDVDLSKKRCFFHFLGKAAWKVKNISSAINIIKKTKNSKLVVLGGNRLNFKMGFRFTLSRKIKFKGMVTDQVKSFWMSQSKGLLFPVRWYEPFGLAIIESLYFGCPVFGSRYGSLPELVSDDTGFLSNCDSSLRHALSNASTFNKRHLHEYARDCFNSDEMAKNYISYYEVLLNGKTINKIKPKVKYEYRNKYLEWEV